MIAYRGVDAGREWRGRGACSEARDPTLRRLGALPLAPLSGDTTPCKVTPVILHATPCRMTGVTLHGFVSPDSLRRLGASLMPTCSVVTALCSLTVLWQLCDCLMFFDCLMAAVCPSLAASDLAAYSSYTSMLGDI